MLFRAGLLLASLTGAISIQAQVNLFFPPRVTDRPDSVASDSNGDGIDGMKHGPIYVSTLHGDDSNTGEIDSPLKTIGVALCVAEALGGRPVYVNEGAYFESIVPFPNTELFGAYRDINGTSTSWGRNPFQNSKIFSATQCPVYVPNLGSKFVFEEFSAIAWSTSSLPAMFLVDPTGGHASLVGSEILQIGKAADGVNGAVGANGGNGLNGGNGGNGKSGLSGTSVAGGSQGLGAKFSGANPRNGGNGGGGGWADSNSWYRGYNGEAGGGAGGARGTGGQPGATHWNKNGEAGTAGSTGAPASDAGAQGERSDAIFDGHGGDGTDGQPGNGGGGGGGGGSYLADFVVVLSGGGGGGGGAGGGGGKGGKGGTAGKPLFGLVWANVAASTLDLGDGLISVTKGGKGGDGGDGGWGGSGGAGGAAGATGVTANRAGKGGAGGNGSSGYGGFGGAGGRGGASIGILAPSLLSGQIQGGSIAFPDGAASGGIGTNTGQFGGANNYGLPGALLPTYVSAQYPNIFAGIPAETPRLLASAARAKTAVGRTIRFRPKVMLRNVGNPELFLLSVRESSQYRGTFSVGNDLFDIPEITYTPNVGGGGSPNYEEHFLYDLEEPIYNAQGHFIGYNLTTWKGIISVCLEAKVTVSLQDWMGPSADSNLMLTLVEPAENGKLGFVQEVPLVNGESTILIPNGNMPLRVKYGHWLSQVRTPVVQSSGLRYEFDLLNGDCDGDNEVTVFDYIELSNAFMTVPGNVGWNPDADLDGDGEVTIFDYIILSGNFDLSGDE